MEPLRFLLHLGDIALVLPIAVALAAWLVLARAWRMAFWWSLLFALAIGMVGVSKIAYLAWGGGMPQLAFKSFSGHAAGAMALYPVLFDVLCNQMLPGPRLPLQRRLAFAAGALPGLTVTLLLVVLHEHSLAEAVAGCLLGAAASAGTLGLAAAKPLHLPRARAVAGAALAGAAVASLMGSVPVGYWMIKAARTLSGQPGVHSLSFD